MVKKGKAMESGVPQFLSTAAVGAGVSFGVALLVMTAGSALIAAGTLPEDGMVRVCCVGMGLGCLMGGLYAALTLRTRVLPLALAVSVSAFVLWLVLGQGMYGGVSPTGVLRGGLCALIGGVTAGFLAAGGKKSRN